MRVAFTSITDSISVDGLTTPLDTTIRSYMNCILIPPFLATAIIDTGGLSIPELITSSILRIKSYNNEHSKAPGHEPADMHCQLILGWLLIAHKNQLTAFATVLSIAHQILSLSSTIHLRSIHSHLTTTAPQGIIASSDDLSQVATNIFEQTTLLQSINTSKEEKKRQNIKVSAQYTLPLSK